jgi:hypothetical protein
VVAALQGAMISIVRAGIVVVRKWHPSDELIRIEEGRLIGVDRTSSQ